MKNLNSVDYIWHEDRLNPESIRSLSPEAQKWFARAIAGMINSDGIVDSTELDDLLEAIGLLNDIDEISDLVSMVKNREKPELPILKKELHPPRWV